MSSAALLARRPDIYIDHRNIVDGTDVDPPDLWILKENAAQLQASATFFTRVHFGGLQRPDLSPNRPAASLAPKAAVRLPDNERVVQGR